MLYSPRLYFKDLWISIPLAASLLVQVFIWLDLLLNVRRSEEQVFLHYNMVIGVDKVGEWWRIFYLPLAGLLVLLCNMIVSLVLYRTERFLAKVLSFFVIFFHLFLLIAVIFLVGLNS